MPGAWVQDDSDLTQDNGGSFASVAKQFTNTTTSGNLVYVAAGCSGNVTPTCADTQGDTYVLKTNTYDVGQTQSHFQFYAKNITGGTKTVTVTWGGNQAYNRLQIMEISGCDTSAPDDGGAAQRQAGGTTTDYYSSGNITTTATDFCVGSIQNLDEASPGSGTLTAGATPAYTLRETAGTNVVGMETLAGQAAATFDANFTRDTTLSCITAMMAFKEAAAAFTGDDDGLWYAIVQEVT